MLLLGFAGPAHAASPMFRWLRRREGKRIVAEVGEPPENRLAEPPDQIAELIRTPGKSGQTKARRLAAAKGTRIWRRRKRACK